MRYPDLVEFRAVCPETQPLVEAPGVRLGVQVHLGEATLGGQLHEATHDRDARPGAAVRRQYGDTANLTGGLEPSRANQVTFSGSEPNVGEHVRDDGVEFVPLLVLRDALFFDENSPAHAFDRGAVGLPRREVDVEILRLPGGHRP